MSNTFTKGSKWQKWDLHVHTKGAMKNDQFKSKTFDEYCVTLFKKALENGIAAIGITDSFDINNYTQVNVICFSLTRLFEGIFRYSGNKLMSPSLQKSWQKRTFSVNMLCIRI